MRSPHNLDSRLVSRCDQDGRAAAGRFVALEQGLAEHICIRELATHRQFGLPLSLTEWLSNRFRIPTNRDRGPFAAAAVALSQH